MAVRNHNFRFNEKKEAERKAWQILHSEEVKEDFRSQNEFVIAAINDYYARHLALKRDPYLESREKEDAFVKGIVEAVEQKVLDNLPGVGGHVYDATAVSFIRVGIKGDGARTTTGAGANAADGSRNADVRAGICIRTRVGSKARGYGWQRWMRKKRLHRGG